MNLISSCKKIACFRCGELNEHDVQLCSSCSFDIGSELSARLTSCMYLRLTAAAFSLGVGLPLFTLFVIGELGARDLPALGVASIFVAVAGCAWLLAQHFSPKFVFEPVSADLRTQQASHLRDQIDEATQDD